MTAFDFVSHDYEQRVENSTGIGLVDHDFYTRRKAELLVDLARRKLGPTRTLSALDVGCGVGLTDSHLARAFGELHGVDPSRVAIGRAREANPTVEYQLSDGESLPYPDAVFDLAFAICVVHHVPPAQWRSFVAELGRVVRPGGLAVVFEHNPLNPLTRVSVSRCDFDEDAVLLRRRQTSRLLESAGLVRVEQRYIIFAPFEFRWIGAGEKRIAGVPLGAQYYVAARRGPSLSADPARRSADRPRRGRTSRS